MTAPTLQVLCVAASPDGTSHLKIDREIKAIKQAFVGAPIQIRLEQAGAVTPRELLQALMRLKPDVLHFSGHGRPDGLLFESAGGQATLGRVEGLAQLIGTLRARPRLVFFNACDSAPAAQAVAAHVTCAVGCTEPVGDQGATVFAGAFYDALAHGEPFATAGDTGRSLLALEGLDGADDVSLFAGPGVDLSVEGLLPAGGAAAPTPAPTPATPAPPAPQPPPRSLRLARDEVDTLLEVALQHYADRDLLLAFLPPMIKASLPRLPAPGDQLRSDLTRLMSMDDFAGEAPLVEWLRNLAHAVQIFPRAQGRVQAILARLTA